MSSTIALTKMEQVELTQRATSQAGRADEARRARLILLLDADHTWAQIREKLDCTDSFIDRWSKRFVRERLAGLFRTAGGASAPRFGRFANCPASAVVPCHNGLRYPRVRFCGDRNWGSGRPPYY